MKNCFEIRFKALSINEGFARTAVAAFCLQLNPSVDQLSDIKTAVSEAVTNCVVHAYPNKQKGWITLTCEIEGRAVKITIKDDGIGIKDFEKARQPFFTSKPSEERSGMGFTIMETFMDSIDVQTKEKCGTTVTLTKNIALAKEATV